jgi:hypothetical protein
VCLNFNQCNRSKHEINLDNLKVILSHTKRTPSPLLRQANNHCLRRILRVV